MNHLQFASDLPWSDLDTTQRDNNPRDFPDFSKETRILNQQRTIIPEFTISRYAEDVIRSVGTEGTSYEEKIEQMSDFLEITGAVYNTSSHVFEIWSQFFKTYSTGDFLKYFADFKTSIERNSASDDSGESDFGKHVLLVVFKSDNITYCNLFI